MTIWASHDPIGTEVRSDRARDFRGVVLSFATGWSSHYPSTGGDVEQPAAVRLASIPRWCVPGHEDEEDFESTGPWVRVDLEGWRHIDGQSTGERVFQSVILDEDAARSLASDLLEWVNAGHVYPL